MSEVIGKMIFCDRCGNKHFLKYTKTDELDGGFTKVPKYEKYPDGWDHSYDLKMELCPDCAREWNDIMQKFKEVDKCPQ